MKDKLEQAISRELTKLKRQEKLIQTTKDTLDALRLTLKGLK